MVDDSPHVLSYWEGRRAYYTGIELGQSVKQIRDTIAAQSAEMARDLTRACDGVVANQDYTAKLIEEIAVSSQDVARGIEGLGYAFEWGISQVVWQLEQTRKELRSIVELLQAPLDTQAKERRKRAEEAYSNGWIEEAEEEYLESEKLNRYDFSIHMSLGIIYAFHRRDMTKAIEYFAKAAKYAQPKSRYHRCLALLHGAFCLSELGDVGGAHKLSVEAIEAFPELAEAYYESARYCALAGKQIECLERLETAFRLDPRFCLRAEIELAFSTALEPIRHLVGKLRDEEVATLQTELAPIRRTADGIEKALNRAGVDKHGPARKRFEHLLDQFVEFSQQGGYLDALRARGRISFLQFRLQEYLNAEYARVETLALPERSKIGRALGRTESAGKTVGYVLGLGGLALGILLGWRGCTALVSRSEEWGFLEFLVLTLGGPATFLAIVAATALLSFGVGYLLVVGLRRQTERDLRANPVLRRLDHAAMQLTALGAQADSAEE